VQLPFYLFSSHSFLLPGLSSSILCADVGIKWAPVPAPAGDSFTYNVQMALDAGGTISQREREGGGGGAFVKCIRLIQTYLDDDFFLEYIAENVTAQNSVANATASETYAFQVCTTNSGGLTGPWSSMYLPFFNYISLQKCKNKIILINSRYTYTVLGLPSSPFGVTADSYSSSLGLTVHWQPPYFIGGPASRIQVSYLVEYSLDSIKNFSSL
jgi:hypothetical protein